MRDIITRTGILNGGDAVNSSPGAKEVTLQEFNDPTSITNMTPPIVRKYMEQIPPPLLGCSDRELEKKLQPTQIDETLRLAFWDEYQVAVDAKRPMKMSRVYEKICTKELFYKAIITNPLRLAYMLRPPMDYTYKMRDLLELGHRRMREILELPMVDSRGKPDTRLITEIVKIVALVENRVRGAVVHKVQMEQKSVNINVAAPKDYFTITDELKQLEKEIRTLEIQDGERNQEDPAAEIIEGQKVEVASGERVDEIESSSPVRSEVLQVAEDVL